MTEDTHDENRSEDEQLERMETHRPLVRETDKKVATIYGFGGAAVLLAAAIPILIAWALGFLGYLAPWVIAVTVGLIALFVLNAIVRRKKERFRERVDAYCRLNDLDPHQLRDYYAREEMYPYFLALFEDASRTEAASSERTE